MSRTNLNCRSRSDTSFRAANVNSRAINSRRRWERNAFSRLWDLRVLVRTHRPAPSQPLDLTFLTLRFTFHPRDPRLSSRGINFPKNTLVYIKTHSLRAWFPSDTALDPKFQSTFHHRRPVFTTCLHFFTYSHAPFRSAVPAPKNTSVYTKTHSLRAQ